ncbi:MAG: hypothetical protein O2822_09250, partial [Chloroflexi bacterium]|nr:hypothetical protein [Chloroflexota bacterium]
MILDTRVIVPISILLASTALFALLTAAEAVAIHIARRRVTRDPDAGLGGLLREYVAIRQRTSRALRTGATAATVAATMAAIAIVPDSVGANGLVAGLA